MGKSDVVICLNVGKPGVSGYKNVTAIFYFSHQISNVVVNLVAVDGLLTLRRKADFPGVATRVILKNYILLDDEYLTRANSFPSNAPLRVSLNEKLYSS